jgi:opacity protein-like surface antigen
MNTKIKLLPLLASLLTCVASAAVYVDLRVSHQSLDGTPSIGDIGAKISEDLPNAAVSLALGTHLTPHISAELRFTDLGRLSVDKVSPSWNIFPPTGDVTLPAQRYYRYKQSTRLYTFALPVELFEQNRVTLSVAPLLQLEHSTITIDDLYINVQTVNLLPQAPTRFLETDRTKVRLGAEVGLAYHATDKVKLSLNYSYSSLHAYDVHLLGAGLGLEF